MAEHWTGYLGSFLMVRYYYFRFVSAMLKMCTQRLNIRTPITIMRVQLYRNVCLFMFHPTAFASVPTLWMHQTKLWHCRRVRYGLSNDLRLLTSNTARTYAHVNCRSVVHVDACTLICGANAIRNAQTPSAVTAMPLFFSQLRLFSYCRQ